jgi:hypothetical protein
MGLGQLQPGCECCEPEVAPDCADFAAYFSGGMTSLVDYEMIDFYTSGGSACCEELNTSVVGDTLVYNTSVSGVSIVTDNDWCDEDFDPAWQLNHGVTIQCSANDPGVEDDEITVSVGFSYFTSGGVLFATCRIQRFFAPGEFVFGVQYLIDDNPTCTTGAPCTAGLDLLQTAFVTIHAPA